MEESISKRRGKDRVSELPNLDRFSELPNSLILIILSFLPIRDVVATTILSKRWKNLWTTVPCLNFCELSKYYESDPEKIRNFVNRTLLFWRGVGNLKFKLDFDWDLYLSLSDDVDVWVRFAVEKEVEELSICLICEEIETSMAADETEECAYCLPQCLNSCTSIRELSLVGCNLQMPVSPSWNQLKCLKIDGYCFSKWLINRILLGSPQLEVFELRLVESYDNLNICSTSLKKLKIEKYLMHKGDEPSKDKWLRICCPNLEVFVISGVLYSKYLFTDVSSVTDVTLGFNSSYEYAYGNELLEETLKHIFSSFEGAHKLALSYWCVQVLGVLHKKSLPNVTFFPNVKMLVIKDQTRDTNYEFEAGKCVGFAGEVFDASKYLKFERKLSKSFMLQLKTVDITLNFFKESTFRFIEFLLKYGTMLEDMVIRADKNCSVDWLEVAGRLLSKPKTAQLTLIRF